MLDTLNTVRGFFDSHCIFVFVGCPALKAKIVWGKNTCLPSSGLW